MSTSTSIDPASGQTIATYARHTTQETQVRIGRAQEAFLRWRQTSFAQRSEKMRSLASLFKFNKEQYARLMTSEMGKPIAQSRAEVDKCAWVCDYYADNAEQFLADETIVTEALKSYVTYSPMGVVLAVMPWNFPMYQVIRFAAPALMAGNAALLKHASNVQGCAQALEKALVEAGFPEGLFANLNINGEEVEKVIKDPNVRAVTLTGSEPAGRSVASIAGGEVKKSVLELGGSDAYIVMADADMDRAVELLTKGRLQNYGQTCIAAKRYIVVSAVYEEFVEKLENSFRQVSMGAPTDESNYLGPMARHDLRDELHAQVEKSVAQGARLVLGGEVPNGQGAYYPPTVLAEVGPGMVAFEEELFGPVAAVIRASDIDEAVRLANQSDFGLGAGVICGDVEAGEKVALRLEAGNCFVNSLVASDPRLPFGGMKNSGYGRELSRHGLLEFVNVRTVSVSR